MMRYWRSLLYFAIGFLLASLSVIASAEVIPATPTGGKYWYSQTHCSKAPARPVCGSGTQDDWDTATEDAFQKWSNGNQWTVISKSPASEPAAGVSSVTPAWSVRRVSDGYQGTAYLGVMVAGATTYTCPAGQNWTLSGTNCTRPDCVEPQTRQSDGTCKSSDLCEPTKDKHTSGWVNYTGDKVATGTVCIGGCNYEQNVMLDQDDRIGMDGRKWAQVGQTGLGTSCTGSTTPSMEPDQKNKDSKKPPCAATEGVMTTSTGKVLCVPEGTPDARKPDVKVKTKAETFPDGTTKETKETTTRDPLTGASSTSSSSTATPKPDGTEGQAGPPGTSSGVSTSGSGNGDGDGEGCDPTLNFCGGPSTDGMYTKKEKTMASAFTQFQNTIKGSPLGSASTGFFTVSTPGGSCPAWSVQVPMLNITLNAADYFCNGGILAALQGAGYVMLALATYIAFTWAFL